MANIWPVYEGKEPTYGGPWASLLLAETVDLFQINPHKHFLRDRGESAPFGPRFGDQNRNLRYAGYRHIVVEIEPEEAKAANWKPGYYISPVDPKEAWRLLLQQAVVSELGHKNVVGLEFEPSNDAEGQGILKITVVITPAAVKKLNGVRILGALTKLRDRLIEMREDRAPIVQYATKEEFKQLAGR